MTRDTSAAANTIIYLSDEDLKLFALRDPDIFRDVAAALISERECSGGGAEEMRGIR